MSYVVATPDLVESAAAELAGIRSTLAEAAAIAAGPTTGVASAAQDEVSVAVAALFSNAGREFQAISAQAHAFHAQFVESIRAGAGAYAATEAANAAQVLPLGQFTGSVSATVAGAPAAFSGAIQTGVQGVSRAAAGFETQLAALGTGGAPGLLADLNVFGNQVAGPYQALFGNTVGNLQAIGGTTAANPFPVLNQFVTNQFGYAQAIAGAFGTGLQGLPAGFAGVPAAVQGLLAFDPAPYVQQFVGQQIGYVQTVATSLQNAAHDFGTGLAGLPTALQAGFGSLVAGNAQGAVADVGRGFLNLFFTGFDTVTGTGGLVTITPGGALGDLLPILSIPGQMAQNLTDFIPAGSIPAQLAQHATNVLQTLTATGVTSMINLIPDVTSPIGIGISINADMGLPLVLALEALGGPAGGLNALGSSVTTFANALQTGNVSAAAAAILDAPAVVANGFLNGQATLPLSLTVSLGGTNFPTVLNVPLDGILAPAAPYTALVDSSGLGIPGLILDASVTGTPLSGLVPGLLNFLPADLAAALGGPAAPVIPSLSF